MVVPNILQGVTFNSFSCTDLNFIESLGKFLQRYQQYREILMKAAWDTEVICFYNLNPTIFFLLYTVPQHTLISSAV